MTTTEDGLFPEDGLRAAPEPVEEMTDGQRLRARQQARITAGLHPLSISGTRIPLHPDAPRDAQKDDGRDYPRCGGCKHRETVGGHARSFPKCLLGYERRPLTGAEIRADKGTIYEGRTHHVYMGARYSMSAASDVRAWWPACLDYEARTCEDVVTE